MRKTVTICDRCKKECDPTLRRQIDVGSSYDGHRNERDIVLIELCKDCSDWWHYIHDALTGEFMGSNRPFTNEQADQALAIICEEMKRYIEGVKPDET